MNQIVNDRIVIMALNLISESVERDILRDYGLTFAKAYGHYKGIPERSWVIIANDEETYLKCIALARTYQQESILLSSQDRTTHLMYTDIYKTPEYIGVLQRKQDNEPLPESYTEFNGEIWVTK